MIDIFCSFIQKQTDQEIGGQVTKNYTIHEKFISEVIYDFHCFMDVKDLVISTH